LRKERASPVKYWLTTHYPPRIDDPDPGVHYGVWLQPDKLHVAANMAEGDLVFMYETQGNRDDAVCETYSDGSPKVIPRRRGKQGLVTLAEILDRPSHEEGRGPEHYADGNQRWWKYLAPTRNVNSSGFIPREELAAMLGYSRAYVFRGFGTGRSGLREIPEDLFLRLKERFLNPVARRDEQVRSEILRRRWGGPGGEGPVHLALKTAIAADPEAVLGEPGLRHWRTEYELPTGDTVDVVLTDRYGRFVVVEVEVDCDHTELVGPLQCMKYRALMSYLHRRRPEEVRAFLIAHSIHDTVSDACSRYDIDCRVVLRPSMGTPA
jgi:hypothetical protein